MKIAIIGTGYVGLVSGACLAELGWSVTCVDCDGAKIQALQRGVIPIYEPGLQELVHNNSQHQRLTFTTDLAAAVAAAEVILIAVGTPPHPVTQHADLKFVEQVATEIGQTLHRLPSHTNSYKVVVNKSTVPVGTAQRVTNLIAHEQPNCGFAVVSNPEFLREGSAIADFMRPDRIVVGCEHDQARAVMERLYAPLTSQGYPLVVVRPATAELIKYAANSFLAMKITFINEIADLAEACGANVQEVAAAIGMDHRISPHFLNPGPGYGGSCFPKDVSAMIKIAADYQVDLKLVTATHTANQNRKHNMAARILANLPELSKPNPKDWGAKITVGVCGVTFKPNTDDVRESPALEIISQLQQNGIIIKAYDPEGMTNAKPLLPEVQWCSDAYETARNAAALVVITEWDEFRGLDLERLRTIMQSPNLIDLRNLYDPQTVRACGFRYYSLGR